MEEFDWFTYAGGVVSGLIVGGGGVWLAHYLAGRRSRHEQKQRDAIETIERVVEVFNARADFVTMAVTTTNRARVSESRSAYLALWQNYWWARPEEHVDPKVWDTWMEAEKAAGSPGGEVWEQRRKRLREARIVILDWLASRRRELLR